MNTILQAVRQHSTKLTVILSALVAAGITDLLSSPWASSYANGGPEGIGWLVAPIVAPLVAFTTPLGMPLTFIAMWAVITLYAFFIQHMIAESRYITTIRQK